MGHISAVSSLILLSAVSSAVSQSVTWTACETGLQCGSITVPLDYSKNSAAKATIPLIKYPATVAPGGRLGSILVNPGGPGASGVGFITAGAGAAISTISGGAYDIVSWDTRGVNSASPLLECFPNAGVEYDFASALPSAPNVWSGEFTNSSYNAQIHTNVTNFDTAIGRLSEACVQQNSTALYTSSSAFVARDMAAIVDAVDGVGAKLNYWGYSYGTIYLAEFIQTFPTRVGRVIADGVVDPDISASIPISHSSVGPNLDALSTLCEQAGPTGCSFAAAPTGNTKTVRERIDDIFEDLFQNPIVSNGVTIDMSVLASTLNSFQLVPTTWKALASVLQGLEARDPAGILAILSANALKPPQDRSAPGTALLADTVLDCIDQSASASMFTISNMISLLKTLFIIEKDPIAGASITGVSFCRHFPTYRPLPRIGVAKMPETDAILQAANTKVLIVSSMTDPATPLVQAQKLRSLLPHSSLIAVRTGPGHTTISYASLGMAKIINGFFSTAGVPALPVDQTIVTTDQVIFPANVAPNGVVTPATFNGTYTTAEKALLEATYNVGLAFLALA